jgi:hypothetical protein
VAFSFVQNKHNRPKLDSPYTIPEIIIEIGAIVCLLSGLLVFAISWSSIPELGQLKINLPWVTWEGKRVLLTFPITSLVIYLLLTFSSRQPHKFNYPWQITVDNAERQYQAARLIIITIKLQTTGIFLYLNWIITSLATGKFIGFMRIDLILFFLVLVFGSIGFLFLRLYRLR